MLTRNSAVCDGEDIEVYSDDIGAFSLDWELHVELLGTVVQRLRDNGFTINPLKCEWQSKKLTGSDFGLL